MKLNLTTGLVPNLNVSAALLTFMSIETWTKPGSKRMNLYKIHERSHRRMTHKLIVERDFESQKWKHK
ncbi:hypothetical protein Dsin_000901 [Dipteronia sinensis]|uniref:Uncharacterized protein n=1 Tax=Dipteronia sinensis TaxID=43782 RepID=A0AAE0B476_9ROSI|nr:hypothetical protein Dsin_000901 [Dipteronia sinensis]